MRTVILARRTRRAATVLRAAGRVNPMPLAGRRRNDLRARAGIVYIAGRAGTQGKDAMRDAVQATSPTGADTGATALRFGGFAFDPVRGVLRQPSGAETVLRPKSPGLLYHLARHAGQVVGRDALLDAVWPDVSVTDDSITQCVTEIRRALGAEGAALLRTLPKRGYLLDTAVTTDAARPHAAAPPAADAAGEAAAVRPSGSAVVPSRVV